MTAIGSQELILIFAVLGLLVLALATITATVWALTRRSDGSDADFRPSHRHGPPPEIEPIQPASAEDAADPGAGAGDGD